MSGPIPESFYSDRSGKPIRKCVMCEKDLIASGEPYAIEKAMKRTAEGDVLTLFEMAICIPCGQRMNQRMSEHSKRVIEEYFESIHLNEKRVGLGQEDWQDKWDKVCVVTGKPLSEVTEFNLIGNFIGDRVIAGIPPVAISGEIMEQLQEKISPETRQEMDDFRDTYLGPDDPQLKALLSETQFVLL